MKENIQHIIAALMELEAKGCHKVFFEYGNGLFRVRILKCETEKIVHERTINLIQEQAKLNELFERIEHLNLHVKTTLHQCYRRDFELGELSGEWEKTKPFFEFGVNATQAMQIDGSGYFVDDPDNRVQYFVDLKQLSTTN